MTRFRDMKYTIASALMAGWLAYPALMQIPSAIDHFFPVVTMSAQLVSQERDSVTIHIQGEKHRSCRFVQLDSYYKTISGVMVDANEIRLDGQIQDGSTKPVGSFDLGLWRIFPAPQDRATEVEMFVEHDCNGRLVITKIADIPLELKP